MCNQQEMDINKSLENVSVWSKMKRQHSPSSETRTNKKRNVTEHVHADTINNKENLLKMQSSEQNGRKSYNVNKRFIKEKSGKEAVAEQQSRERHPVYFTGQDIENDLDMDDMLQINLNLDKVPIKYCDDRMYVDLVLKNDMRSQESFVDEKSRQTDDNFKQKIKRPMDELLDLFKIQCNEGKALLAHFLLWYFLFGFHIFTLRKSLHEHLH